MRIGTKPHYWCKKEKINIGQCVDLIINQRVVETIKVAYIHFNKDSANEIWFGKINPYTGEFIGKSKILKTYSEIRETTNKKLLRKMMIDNLDLI
jgi:hypothetical protein